MPLKNMLKLSVATIFKLLLVFLTIQITFSSCNPRDCNDCISGDDNTCQICDPQYFIVGRICCHETCTTCTASWSLKGQCTSCANAPYYAQSWDQKCIKCQDQIPNCLTCTTLSQCSTCLNNSFLINSMSGCSLCSSFPKLKNCIECSSSTTCTKCVNTSLTVNSTHQCAPCITVLNGCLACSSSSVCTACAHNTFALNASANQCETCSSLMAECTSCSSTTVCLTCSNNSFAIDPTSKCSTCATLLDGCATCTSSTVCDSCINNSIAINPSTNQCETCLSLLDGCSNCNSSTVCIACINNTLVLHAATNACVTCQSAIPACYICSSNAVCVTCTNDSFAIDFSSSQCSTCLNLMPQCLNCDSQTICTKCVNDSYIVSPATNLCVTCITFLAGCSTCDSSTICTKCANDSYIVSPDTDLCVTCITFLAGCSNCNSSTICTSCINNSFVLNVSTNICDLCSSVLSQCSNCSSAIVCTACINNSYAVNSTFMCSPCSQLMVGCSHCNSSSICVDCISDTLIINPANNSCVACSFFLNYCTNCNNTSVCLQCDFNPNIVLSNQTCQSCISVIANCLNCTSTTICTVCRQRYFLSSPSCTLCGNAMYGCIQCSSATNCTKCSLRYIVINGCSNTPGCIAVTQNITSALCSQCDPIYYNPVPIKGICSCKKGHLAGLYCTEIVGCVNINRDKNGDMCISCESSKHFVLKDGTCICETYYENNGQTCTQICGDGKLINLACDDGNNINGDGCSSTCQIQPGYSCTDGKCIYKGFVKFSYVCVYKVEDNLATIKLQMSPYISNILKSDYNILFNCSKNCSLASYHFVDSYLNLEIGYSEDVQGETANVTIQYDKNYIVNPDSFLTIKLIECNGDRLYYNPNPSKGLKTLIDIIAKIISGLTLFIWLIGSYSHKMIGVQTLHTIQLIFVPQVFAHRYLPVVAYFNQLCNTLNLFQAKIRFQQFLSSTYQSRLQYSADFIYNYSAVAIFQLIVLLAFGSFVIYERMKRSLIKLDKKRKEERDYQPMLNAKKYRKSLYDFLVFPSFIGFFLNFALSLMFHSYRTLDKSFRSINLQGFIILLTTISISFVFFHQWKSLFIHKKKDHEKIDTYQSYKQDYVPLYLTNFLMVCLAILSSLSQLVQTPYYCLLILNIFTLFAIIFYRPYRDKFHNLCLIINQIGSILSLCWLVSQEFIYIPKNNEEYVAVILIGWMILILILAILRIIYEIRKDKSPNSKVSKAVVCNNRRKESQQLQMEAAIMYQSKMGRNKYLLRSQFLKIERDEKRQEEQKRKFHLEMLNSRILHNHQSQDSPVFKVQAIKRDIPRINTNEPEENLQ